MLLEHWSSRSSPVVALEPNSFRVIDGVATRLFKCSARHHGRTETSRSRARPPA